MNIWDYSKWKSFYLEGYHRSGMRMIYEKGVDPEVKCACNEFVNWLRRKYHFPKRVRIYIKRNRRIKSKDGDMVCGTFFRPADRNVEPYIRIATGDFLELLDARGRDNALATILWSIAHELTHYFQWLNDLNLTFIGEERQASIYAKELLNEYAETREHP